MYFNSHQLKYHRNSKKKIVTYLFSDNKIMVMKKRLFVSKLDFTIFKFLYNSQNSNVGSVKMKNFNKFVYFLKYIYVWGMCRLKTLAYVIVLHNIILKIIFSINVNFNMYCKE